MHSHLGMVLFYISVSSVMALAVSTAVFDQLVTSSITPYLIVSLTVGVVIIVSPYHALAVYFFSYTAFFLTIGIFSVSPAQTLHARLYGLFASVIGLALSYMVWRQNTSIYKQRLKIEQQLKLLEHSNRELERLSFYDVLTHLPNRRYMDDAIKRESALMQLKKHPSSLILLDLDKFKHINDRFGHPGGDCVLEQLSTLLSASIRRYDTLCRLSGDEFVLLLPQTAFDDALVIAESLRALIATHGFKIKNQPVNITASLGVTRLSSPLTAPESQYARADRAMYKAKEQGGNYVCK